MQKAKKKTSISDRATDYAKAVVKGGIIAGPYVRAACQRHLSDLKRKDLRWDLDAADHAIGFFKDVLKLAGGEFEGKPFNLLPWECFVIGSIFGWKKKNGHRRFGVAFVETAKGSGKSPVAAGVGHYMLVADKEARAEVYAVAVSRDQAMVLYRDAVAMYDHSPALRANLNASGAKGREWNMYYSKMGSFFRPISSESTGRGKSGPRPHCNLFDEVHEHPTNAMITFMSSGKKWRKQALDFLITNSGFDKTSVCYEYHDYGVKIVQGDKKDDNFFAFICALDEGEDPFVDEKCWIKVNPSLPKIPGMDYLRNQVKEAKGMPSKESIVRRLNFCEWVGAESPAFSKEAWDSCQSDIELDEMSGNCVAAIDLSAKIDLTSLTLEFDGGNKTTFNLFFTPKDTLKERENKDRAPYAMWVRDGHLQAVPGRSIDYDFIAYQIKEINEHHPIMLLAFDRWRIDDLIRALDDNEVSCYLAKVEVDDDGIETVVPAEDKYAEGMALLPFGQGFKDMSPAIDDLEADLTETRIQISRNPVTTWCAANAVIVQDPAGNRKLSKQKATGRIDGVISLLMANRVARFLPQFSQYEDPVFMAV